MQKNISKKTGENLKKKLLDTKVIFNNTRQTNKKKNGNKQLSINGNSESRSATSEAFSIINKNSSMHKKSNYSKNSSQKKQNYLDNSIKSKKSAALSFFSKKSDIEKIVNNISNFCKPNNQIYFEDIRDKLLQNNNSQNQIEEDCLVNKDNYVTPTMQQQITYGRDPTIVNKETTEIKTQTNTIPTTQQKKASNTLAMEGLENNKKRKCKCWCY